MSSTIIDSIEEGIYSRGSIQVRTMVDESSQPTILDTIISPYAPRDVRIVNTVINTSISGTGDIESTIELLQPDQTPFIPPITTTVDPWGDFEMVVPLGTIVDNTTYYLRMSKGDLESVSPLTQSTLASPIANYGFSSSLYQPLVVNVTRLAELSYQYSIDGGKNWNSLSGTRFILDAGIYVEGDVQVIAMSDSAVSAPTIMPPIISPYLLVADELQIDADHDNYIFSGRAEPGSTVRIQAGTATSSPEVASGTVDEYGHYRIVLDSTQLSGTVRAFTLRMTGVMGPSAISTTQSIPDLNYPAGWIVSFREEQVNTAAYTRYAVLGPTKEDTEYGQRDIIYRVIWSNNIATSMTPYIYSTGTVGTGSTKSRLYVDNINLGYMMDADPVVARASRYLLRTELNASNYPIVIPYPRDVPQEGIVAVEGWNRGLPIRAAVRTSWNANTSTIIYPSTEFPTNSTDYTFYVRAAGRNISRSIQYRLDILSPESSRGLYGGNDQNRDLVIYLTQFNSSGSNVSTIDIDFTRIRSTPSINLPSRWVLLSSPDYTITRPVPGIINGVAKIVIPYSKVLDYIRDNTTSGPSSYVINTIDMDISITAAGLANYNGVATMNSIQTTITIN